MPKPSEPKDPRIVFIREIARICVTAAMIIAAFCMVFSSQEAIRNAGIGLFCTVLGYWLR
jgi:hypothetical protein